MTIRSYSGRGKGFPRQRELRGRRQERPPGKDELWTEGKGCWRLGAGGSPLGRDKWAAMTETGEMGRQRLSVQEVRERTALR